MAAPYPSNITVSGLGGTVITHVQVKLNGVTHTFPDDIDILLVGPGGQNAIIMSDVGGGNPGTTGVTLTLDDFAATSLPDAGPLVTGLSSRLTSTPGRGPRHGRRPHQHPRGGSALSVFNGTAPNGTWSLYVVDDEGTDSGSIAGGWELSITTDTCSDANSNPRINANARNADSDANTNTNTNTDANTDADTRLRRNGFGFFGAAKRQHALRGSHRSTQQWPRLLSSTLTDLNGGIALRRGLIAFDFSSIPTNAIIYSGDSFHDSLSERARS